MREPIQIEVSGKWILVGEHSIMRGKRAVSIPRNDLFLRLKYRHTQEKEFIVHPEAASNRLKSLIRICETHPCWTGLSAKIKDLQGTLNLDSSIPLGAGLGSSAAFCLAVVKWLSCFDPLPEANIWRVATDLENQFHGKSSGIDVATVSAGEPIAIRIIRDLETSLQVPVIRKLGVTRLPRFTFHDTGLRSSTSSCVQKVEKWIQDHPQLGAEVDRQMDQAAGDAEQGLLLYSQSRLDEGLNLLVKAMKQAHLCFSRWDLVPQSVKELQSILESRGAIATKLTGSGDGGILVALWKSETEVLP